MNLKKHSSLIFRTGESIYINVEVQVYLGSRALPTVLNFFVNMIDVVQYCTKCFYLMYWISSLYL